MSHEIDQNQEQDYRQSDILARLRKRNECENPIQNSGDDKEPQDRYDHGVWVRDISKYAPLFMKNA